MSHVIKLVKSRWLPKAELTELIGRSETWPMAMLQLRRAVCLRRQRDFEGAKEVWQMVVWCLFLVNGEWGMGYCRACRGYQVGVDCFDSCFFRMMMPVVCWYMLMIFDDGRWLLGGKRVVVIRLECCMVLPKKKSFAPVSHMAWHELLAARFRLWS